MRVWGQGMGCYSFNKAVVTSFVLFPGSNEKEVHKEKDCRCPQPLLLSSCFK